MALSIPVGLVVIGVDPGKVDSVFNLTATKIERVSTHNLSRIQINPKDKIDANTNKKIRWMALLTLRLF